jgi:hypothetical protein
MLAADGGSSPLGSPRRMTSTPAIRPTIGLPSRTVLFVRQHWLLVALLLVGTCLRIAAMFAYRPALFFGDSWGYISTAFSGHTLGNGSPAISNYRPSGYPVLIWLLSGPSRNLAQVITVQHVAGLLTGILIYAALIRSGIVKWLAGLASALVLLDGYAITLEQYVMADTFFALTVLVACLMLAWPALRAHRAAGARKIGWARSAVAGLLIACSTLERLEGLFVAPIVIGYLVWVRVGWRALLAFTVALGVPLFAYAGLEAANFGTFGLSQWSGWTAYARVAGFADCQGAGTPSNARPLCETAAQRASHPDASVWYLFDPASPAVRMFGPISRSVATQRHSDSVLSQFALRITLHQPLTVVSTITLDFLRFFEPGAAAFDDSTGATVLPTAASAEYVDQYALNQYVPAVRLSVHPPSRLLRSYRSVIHVPRPLLALLAIASIAAIALRLPQRREVVLLSGSALALLAGTAATAGFAQRYLLCAVPLLAIGGTLALLQLKRHTAQFRPTATNPDQPGTTLICRIASENGVL